MGTVIKVASDFIGLLVLGVFNASIAADAVGPDYKKMKAGVRNPGGGVLHAQRGLSWRMCMRAWGGMRLCDIAVAHHTGPHPAAWMAWLT